MIRKHICLSILLLCTLTMSIPVNAQEATPEITQVVQEAEPQPELQVETQSTPQVETQVEQVLPQVTFIQFAYVSSANVNLSISSSGTVSAGAYISGYPSTVTSITGYLYFERKSGSLWVNDWSWDASTSTSFLSMSETCSAHTHATYRLRLVGYVYSGSSYEKVTFYSNEFTY